MKRIVCMVLSVLMAFGTPAMTVFAKPVWPVDTGIESESGIVMDMDSGAVLFGQGIHVKKAPASITKLLTALVVIENSNLSDMVTFSNGAVYDVESGSGNKLSLDEGDILSVEDCLYLLLLQSSNQAGNALAEHVSGSREAFVELMNKKIAELGCDNSNFANPSGLNDDNQYTTAYDMALIGIAAYSNPKLLEISSAKSRKIPATKNNPNGATFAMEHKLLVTTDPNSSTYFPYAIAGKTGYTSLAGQTLVTYAQKDTRRLMCVTLKSTAVTHYKDTIALLSFGFDQFQNLNIMENEQAAAVSGPVTIGGASYELADLSIDPAAAVTLPNGAVYTDVIRSVETDLPKSHPKGAVGLLSYTYDDRKVGQTYIISAKKGAEDATAPSEEGETVSASAKGDDDFSDNGKKEAKKEKTPMKIPVKGILTAFGILAAAALICGGFILFKKKQEEERKAMEERRRRRRQRLTDIGYSQDEFDELLQKRQEGGRKSSEKPVRKKSPAERNERKRR